MHWAPAMASSRSIRDRRSTRFSGLGSEHGKTGSSDALTSASASRASTSERISLARTGLQPGRGSTCPPSNHDHLPANTSEAGLQVRAADRAALKRRDSVGRLVGWATRSGHARY
jgi:hypothetical protein